MIFFMFYYGANYLLQFLMLGSVMAMIKIFFKEMRLPEDSYLSFLVGNTVAQDVMLNTYAAAVLMTLFVAVSIPIDRAMNYYRLV